MNISSPVSFKALKIDRQQLKSSIKDSPQIADEYEAAGGKLTNLIDNLDRRGLDIELSSALSSDFVCLNILNKGTGEQENCITPGVNADPVRALSQAISKGFDILLSRK